MSEVSAAIFISAELGTFISRLGWLVVQIFQGKVAVICHLNFFKLTLAISPVEVKSLSAEKNAYVKPVFLNPSTNPLL